MNSDCLVPTKWAASTLAAERMICLVSRFDWLGFAGPKPQSCQRLLHEPSSRLRKVQLHNEELLFSSRTHHPVDLSAILVPRPKLDQENSAVFLSAWVSRLALNSNAAILNKFLVENHPQRSLGHTYMRPSKLGVSTKYCQATNFSIRQIGRHLTCFCSLDQIVARSINIDTQKLIIEQ